MRDVFANENEPEEFLEPESLLSCLCAVVSIWGQMVQSEESINDEDVECFVLSLGAMLTISLDDEEEEELGIYDLNSERLLQLEEIGFDKDRLREILTSFLQYPLNLRKIVRIADELELEEDFYFEACKFVAYKKSKSKAKQEFLNQFGDKLGLSLFDKNSILDRAYRFFDALEQMTEGSDSD